MTAAAQRATRNRNLRRALGTSLVARAAGFLLQVISLPMAAAALGPQGFSVYSMIAAVLAWLTLSNLGISQATTLHMAREPAADRRRAIFSASWSVVLITSSTVLLLAIGLVLFTPLPQWLFAKQVAQIDTVYVPLLFVCFVFFATQTLSIFEAAQLAEQRQDQTNLATALGTTAAAAAVYGATRHAPSVLAILLAVYLPVLIARSVNALRVWHRLQFANSVVSPQSKVAMRPLLKDGLRFVSGSTISNFLCHPFSILAVGAYSDSMVTASFSAVMNAIILAASVFGLLIAPLRGALPEAHAQADSAWVRKSYVLVMRATLTYALVPCLLLAVCGEWIFGLWYQGAVKPTTSMLVGAGLYVLLLGLEVVHYNFLSSLGQLTRVSRWMLFKSTVSAAIVWWISSSDRADHVFWVLVLAHLLLSTLPLGIMMKKMLQERDGKFHEYIK